MRSEDVTALVGDAIQSLRDIGIAYRWHELQLDELVDAHDTRKGYERLVQIHNELWLESSPDGDGAYIAGVTAGARFIALKLLV